MAHDSALFGRRPALAIALIDSRRAEDNSLGYEEKDEIAGRVLEFW